MELINLKKILKIYKSVLDESMSFDLADRWAWRMMELDDKDLLVYDPPEKENYLHGLVSYLYGLDVPRLMI